MYFPQTILLQFILIFLGMWPEVAVIGDQSGAVTDDLHSSIDLVKSYVTPEDYREDGSHKKTSPKFFVLLITREFGNTLKLFDEYPSCQVYIHCDRERLDYFDRLSEAHPMRCSVYQQLDVLRYALSFDLSDSIVKLGEYYDRINRTDLAQRRYRYARRLRQNVQTQMERRLETAEHDS